MQLDQVIFDLLTKFYLKKYSNQLRNIKEFKTAKTFLVISNTALGDTLLTIPLLKSIKLNFPSSKIVFVLKENYIPLFKYVKEVDYFVPFYSKYKRFFKIIKEIKKHSPEIALIADGNAPEDIQISIFGGCNFILKTPTTTSYKKYLSYQFDFKFQHTIEDRLALLRVLGAKTLTNRMDLNLPKSDLFRKYKGYIGFQVGAADKYKMWPIENFIKLAKYLISQGEKIIITGVKKEKRLGDKIVKECGSDVINMCGKTSIETLPFLINNLKMLITNDTGTMHLAIALKTPTVSLFAATDPKGIGPYQDLNIHKVVYKDGSFIQKLPKKQRDDSAMRLIQVSDVIKSYRELNENLSL